MKQKPSSFYFCSVFLPLICIFQKGEEIFDHVAQISADKYVPVGGKSLLPTGNSVLRKFYLLLLLLSIFMPQISKKLRGHIGLGLTVSPPVRPYVTLHLLRTVA